MNAKLGETPASAEGRRGLRNALPHRRKNRRGAAMVEAAIVILVFLMLVLGTLDLAIGVFRYNTVSELARQGARQTIVHGKLAAPLRTTWGPATYTGTGNDGSEITRAVQPSLVGLDPASTTIKIEWIDGDNNPAQRVRYTVTTQYKPVMTFIFGNPTFILKASSTMPIAH